MVLFFSRDCEGGTGPEVDAAAPVVELGKAATGAVVWPPPKLKVGADVAGALGAAAAVDLGGPKLKPDAAGAAGVALAAAVGAVVACEVLDAGGLPNSEPPVAGAGAGVVPKRPPLGASALVVGVEEGGCEPLSKEKAGLGADSDDDVVAGPDGSEKEGLGAASPGAVAAGLEKRLPPAGCEGPDCAV